MTTHTHFLIRSSDSPNPHMTRQPYPRRSHCVTRSSVPLAPWSRAGSRGCSIQQLFAVWNLGRVEVDKIFAIDFPRPLLSHRKVAYSWAPLVAMAPSGHSNRQTGLHKVAGSHFIKLKPEKKYKPLDTWLWWMWIKLMRCCYTFLPFFQQVLKK